MKKVLIVAYHYPPVGSSSGVLRTLKFTKYLPRHGWLPHVLTVREWLYSVRDYGLVKDIPPEAVVYRTFALDSTRHLAIKGHYPSFLAIPDRFISWFPFGVIRGFHLIRSADIHTLYSTSPHPTAHLIACALKAVTGLPWVADFRDPWIEEGLYPRRGTLRYWVESTLERLVVRYADRLIVTTPHLQRNFMSRYPELQSDKVRTIYNGYDEDDFKGLGDYPARGDRFEIVHAGLVSADYRDPSPLLHTVAHLIATGGLQPDDVRITFLGGGSYVRSRNFAESVEGLGLGKVVEVTDRVSYQTALQRLQTAAVLLLLQASDDTKALIPAKAFEYLRIGRPILALVFNGATADLMRGMEHCYVVDPANQSTLRSTLMTLYKLWQQSPGGVRVSRPILQYERRNLTAELARLLEGLVEATVSG